MIFLTRKTCLLQGRYTGFGDQIVEAMFLALF